MTQLEVFAALLSCSLSVRCSGREAVAFQVSGNEGYYCHEREDFSEFLLAVDEIAANPASIPFSAAQINSITEDKGLVVAFFIQRFTKRVHEKKMTTVTKESITTPLIYRPRSRQKLQMSITSNEEGEEDNSSFFFKTQKIHSQIEEIE